MVVDARRGEGQPCRAFEPGYISMYLPPLTTLAFFAGKSLIWGFGAAGGVFVSFLSAITSPL